MRLVLSWVFAMCLAVPGPLWAETRALLIGVSDYDDSIGLSDLNGPANDVRLLRQVLQGQGVTNVTVLADGVADAQRPTRRAILDALAAQAEQAEAGDFIYLHFSGHGTRQPDRSGDESDGLDELFLPADTGRAGAETGLIANAILDDEIGRAVDAIRAKGADVWLVLDSCHSGTGLRAGAVGGVARYVDPAVLGVSAAPASPGPSVGSDSTKDLPGRFMAFYSARADEVAREFDLDPGEEEAYYGLFTAKLAARLETAQGWSFRQLFQAVLSDLNDSSLPGVARLQTPSWDGNLIDTAVFGADGSAGPRQFAVRGDELSAGLVHNVANGTLVSLFAGPADGIEQALGQAQVVDVSATRSFLVPVDADCVPSATALCARQGNLSDSVRFAQVVARPFDLIVVLSPPRDLTSGQPLDTAHPAFQALTDAVAAADPPMSMDPVSFDVETVWDGTTLWFGRRAAVGESPADLPWTPGTEPLGPLLTRISKAEAYASLLDGLTGGGGLFSQNPVTITGLHLPSRVQDLSPPDQPEPTLDECARAFAAVNGNALLTLSPHSELKQCDRLLFQGQGSIDGIRDVNILHIDSRFCVHAAHAQVSGFSTPVQLGGVINICSDCTDNVYSAGDERMYVVISEAAHNSEPLRLAGLVETCDAGATRGGATQQQFVERLGKLAQRPDTRGSFGGLGISNIWVERYDLTVLPRAQVFRQVAAE